MRLSKPSRGQRGWDITSQQSGSGLFSLSVRALNVCLIKSLCVLIRGLFLTSLFSFSLSLSILLYKDLSPPSSLSHSLTPSVSSVPTERYRISVWGITDRSGVLPVRRPASHYSWQHWACFSVWEDPLQVLQVRSKNFIFCRDEINCSNVQVSSFIHTHIYLFLSSVWSVTSLFTFCSDYSLSYLSLRTSIGLWTAFLCLVLVATDASSLVCYITRFTEEAFAALICIIFIYEALEKLFHLGESYPVNTHNNLDELTLYSWELILTFFLYYHSSDHKMYLYV